VPVSIDPKFTNYQSKVAHEVLVLYYNDLVALFEALI